MPLTFGTETVFEYKDKLRLDKKDTKILYELYKDARTPVSAMAKKVGLSKDTIKYRMTRMEKIGLVLGYTAIINLNSLGYHWNILLLQTKFESSQQEKSFVEFLQSSKNVIKVMQCSGKWEYQIDVVYSSMIELNMIVKRIKESTLLLDFSVLNCLKELKYAHVPQVFFSVLDQEIVQAPIGRVDVSKDIVEVDDVDLKIIKALVKNSRCSLLHLSKIAGLSPDATTNRIARLEKNGILHGFMAVVNTALLCDLHGIFAQMNKLPSELLYYLEQHKNIQIIYETGYEYDLFFWITATTIGEYESILAEIKHKFSKCIIKMDTVLALREYKYTEFPDIEVESMVPK